MMRMMMDVVDGGMRVWRMNHDDDCHDVMMVADLYVRIS